MQTGTGSTGRQPDAQIGKFIEREDFLEKFEPDFSDDDFKGTEELQQGIRRRRIIGRLFFAPMFDDIGQHG